jgi:putative DNA methylase
MTTNNDRRLIEDYLPIEAISAEASREKSVRKGHISTLHLWWARRPLVACRAAVYGALVPAPVSKSGRGPKSDFVKRLCKYPGDPKVIAEAQRHILEAHAERLSKELGKPVTVKDIEEGRAPRPKVLDMFAGGGAIPLEALRLGCEAYALELNPVAHIIELCTLVYPQKYGKPDKNAKGSAPDGTWAGLAKEVEHWGKWVLERVRTEIGDLYPPIPDPENPPQRLAPRRQEGFEAPGFQQAQQELKAPGGYLTPVAYLWTRTVRCKNPACGATVPLVRQTWLCKKESRYVALKMAAPKGEKRVRFQVVEATTPDGLGFDPSGFSKGGNASCPFCGTVADIDYVKAEGCAKRMGQQMMTVVFGVSGERGKHYLAPVSQWENTLFEVALATRAEMIAQKLGIKVPVEPLEANPRSFDVQHFGFTEWRDLFTPRQLIAMVTFAGTIKDSHAEMLRLGYGAERAKGVATGLSMVLGRMADYCTSFCTWQPEFIKDTFNSPGLPMVMDYAEANPLVNSSGSWPSALDYVKAALSGFATVAREASVVRGSALATSWKDGEFDAIVTDPPYYDSRSYSNLADHFYVWHKQSVGHLYSEHFASELTPKRSEAIAAPYRHGGVRKDADVAYERMMQKAFEEARRLLKPGAPMTCVYAHKTTAGWATLINSLRLARFAVVEAWPVEMERKVRQNAQETSALASSIFLVARKREPGEAGGYESQVRPELEAIVRERVETLWEHGVSGADLVIAAVGAGLRAFTRFARVEYANGEEMPAERFLAEVEGVVLETLLEKIFGLVGARVSQVDGPSQFYVLWRYAYHASELDAGEAIVFTYGLPVELDGPRGLSAGTRALVEKKKNKYQLRDYVDRGHDDRLGLPAQDGTLAPLIDVLHRVLYLMEHQPVILPQFLSEAMPDLERLRLVANALAGPQLKGGENGAPHVATTAREQAALGKLVANWRSLMEGRITPEERTGVTRRLPGL